MLFCYTILQIASLTHDDRWRLQNVRFFAIESQSDESTRDRPVLHTQMDISDPATFQTFIDTWIIVLREKCRFTLLSQGYPANESLLKCDFFWPRIIVYIFAYCAKIVLFPNLLLRNWRDIVYFIGVYLTLCTVSTYVMYVTWPEIIVQYFTVLPKNVSVYAFITAHWVETLV